MNDDAFPDERSGPATLPPSKSQRKREANALQALGEQLVKCTPTQLSRIPLPDELLAAVGMAQTISQRGGHKRQLQYIGKLMRRLEPAETEAIRAALAAVLPGWRS
jgi:ribosome-associated protein